MSEIEDGKVASDVIDEMENVKSVDSVNVSVMRENMDEEASSDDEVMIRRRKVGKVQDSDESGVESGAEARNFLDNEAACDSDDGDDDEEEEDDDAELAEDDEESESDAESEDEGEEEEEEVDGSNEEVEAQPEAADIKGFFDNEAELSGSEASSDEDEGEDDEIITQEPEEDLPSDDELRNEIGRVYLKQEMDEDKRRLLRYQEQFLDDGDLHGDGKLREKKFRWKNVDNTAWRDVTDSEASEEDDEEAPKPVFKLKPLEEIKMSQKINTEVNTETETTTTTCDVLKKRMFGGASGSITSYIVRDEKLKSVLSLTRKRNSPFRSKQTKRFKTTRKENKESIFDIFANL